MFYHTATMLTESSPLFLHARRVTVVVDVLTLTRIIKSVVTDQTPVTEEYPQGKAQAKGGTRIYHS